MANIFSPRIDAEELANRIRAETGSRRFSTTDLPKPAAYVNFPRIYEYPLRIESKASYTVADFLCLHDGDFLRNAYFTILDREVDENGFEYHLSALRSGRCSRVEILGRLRYSPEGRNRGIKITGLWPRLAIQTAFRIPLLGYLLSLGSFLILLPVNLRKWRHFEALFHQRLQEHRVQFNEMARRTEDSLFSTTEELSRLRTETTDIRLQTQAKADGVELAALKSLLSDGLSQKADAEPIMNEVSEMWKQIIDHKHSIIDQQRRLGILLEESRRRLAKPNLQDLAETMAEEEDHLLDALYVSFEDHFRPPRKDIKKRLEIHLSIVREAQAGTAAAPILDIGCGRGEWLELLAENGLAAKGVDSNRVMIERCRQFQKKDLDVIEAEVVTYLRSLKPNSIGAITGFSFIEHLPFRKLVTIFDEALRVLKPGGVVILASADPEGEDRSAGYFHPSLRNSLPPPIILYLAAKRGFVRIKMEQQNGPAKHPAIPSELRKSHTSYTTKDNSAINPPQGQNIVTESGYSVIAYKA